MTTVWPTIERFLAEHGAAVLMTLAESAGPSGALEWLALAEAQQMMAGAGTTAAFRRFNKALGADRAAFLPTGTSHA
jgi:hypothetical protein